MCKSNYKLLTDYHQHKKYGIRNSHATVKLRENLYIAHAQKSYGI